MPPTARRPGTLWAAARVLAAALCCVLGAGCAGAATAGQSAGPAQSPPPAAGAFALTSSAFADGAAIPVLYSCDGADVSPPLEWHGAPAGTGWFALLVDDPDAGGFVHWSVGLIPATATAIAEGPQAPGYPQGDNGFGRPGWGGPCPPSGTHHYVFRLGAMPAGVAIPAQLSGAAMRSLFGQALAVAQLTGTYTRR